MARAISPATKPIRIVPMMLIMVFSLLIDF